MSTRTESTQHGKHVHTYTHSNTHARFFTRQKLILLLHTSIIFYASTYTHTHRHRERACAIAHTCIHTHTYNTCANTQKHPDIHACTHLYMHTNALAATYMDPTRQNTQTHTRTSTYKHGGWVRTLAHTSTHIHIKNTHSTHAHTCTYKYTHAHIRAISHAHKLYASTHGAAYIYPTCQHIYRRTHAHTHTQAWRACAPPDSRQRHLVYIDAIIYSQSSTHTYLTWMIGYSYQTQIHIYTCICIHIYMYICTCIYILCICIHTYLSIHTNLSCHMSMIHSLCIHLNICIYTYTLGQKYNVYQ